MLPLIASTSLGLIQKTIIKHIIDDQQCKICLQTEKESNQKLISPCNCTGSMQFIHKSCQQKWIQTTLSKQEEISREAIWMKLNFNCQICKSKIDMKQNCMQFIKFYICQILVCSLAKKMKFLLFISIIGVISMNYFVFIHFKNMLGKGIQKISHNLMFFSLFLGSIVLTMNQTFIKISIKDQNFIFQFVT